MTTEKSHRSGFDPRGPAATGRTEVGRARFGARRRGATRTGCAAEVERIRPRSRGRALSRPLSATNVRGRRTLRVKRALRLLWPEARNGAPRSAAPAEHVETEEDVLIGEGGPRRGLHSLAGGHRAGNYGVCIRRHSWTCARSATATAGGSSYEAPARR